MNIKQFEDGITVLTTNHGHEIIYVDDVPVAGRNQQLGEFIDCKATQQQLDRISTHIVLADAWILDIENYFMGELNHE